MKKKSIIFFSCILSVFLLTMDMVSLGNNNLVQIADTNANDTTANQEYSLSDDHADRTEISGNIVLSLESDVDYAINISQAKVRNENAEFIIIGKVESIDGAINYNPARKAYTKIQTTGAIKVEKILKGNISEDVIPFIRLGGVIAFSEYEKGLVESQKIKMDLIKTLSVEEKKTKYVSENIRDNIDIEVGATYLMYLTYDRDYGKYGILFGQYGLMEVDTNTLQPSNSKKPTNQEALNIRVRNNETGKVESLSSIVGEI